MWNNNEKKKVHKVANSKGVYHFRDGKSHTLTIFNDVITDIIWDNLNVKRALLTADAMKFNVDRNDIVYSVTKHQ